MAFHFFFFFFFFFVSVWVHCCQVSFFLEYVYCKFSWCRCHVSAMKRDRSWQVWPRKISTFQVGFNIIGICCSQGFFLLGSYYVNNSCCE